MFGWAATPSGNHKACLDQYDQLTSVEQQLLVLKAIDGRLAATLGRHDPMSVREAISIAEGVVGKFASATDPKAELLSVEIKRVLAEAPGEKMDLNIADVVTSRTLSAFLTVLYDSVRCVTAQWEDHAKKLHAKLTQLLAAAKVTKESILDEELRALTDNEELHFLLLPSQLFSTPKHFDTLHALVSRKPLLAVIDFSQCALGDTFLLPAMGHLAKLQHLKFLSIADNNATAVVGAAIVSSLAAMPVDGGGFPQLVHLNVRGNHFDVPMQQRIEAHLQARVAAASKRPGVRNSPTKVLSLDGGGTKCLAEIEVLCTLERETGSKIGELFDVIVGTSYGALVGLCAMWRIPMAAAKRLMFALADDVFGASKYAFYAYSAGRYCRSWWTGGDWYSSGALADTITKFFAAHGVALPLQFSSEASHSRMVVAAETGGMPSTHWTLLHSRARLAPSAAIPRSRCLHEAPVADVVGAATAAHTFFAPRRIDKDTFTTRNGGNPVLLALLDACREVAAVPGGITIVSVGCGQPASTPSASYLLAKRLAQVHHTSIDPEPIHRTMLSIVAGSAVRYFRLNPKPLTPLHVDTAKMAFNEYSHTALNAAQRSVQDYLEEVHKSEVLPVVAALARAET